MTIRYKRPVSRAAFLSRRVGLVAFFLFLAAVAAHRFGPLETPTLVALMGASAVLAGVALLLAAAGFWSLWQVGASGSRSAVAAVFLAAVPLLPVALALKPALTLPPIHDVTSDMTDPPAFINAPEADQRWLPRRPAPDAAMRVRQREAYSDLTGRRYGGALDRVLEAVRKVADAEGITITAERGTGAPLLKVTPEKPPAATDGEEGAPAASSGEEAVADGPAAVPVPEPRPDAVALLIAESEPAADVILQGETRSLVFGFPSDVVFRLREEEETTLVDMRVSARYGLGDLGSGDAIITSFLGALDAELLGIAGD